MSVAVELVYDSVRMQASFGRRCASDEDRSLLFRAGALSLDVLLYGGEALEGVHGQLVDEVRGRPLPGVAVFLGELAAETDAHGQFSFPIADRTVLRIAVGGRELAFPLPTARRRAAVPSSG